MKIIIFLIILLLSLSVGRSFAYYSGAPAAAAASVLMMQVAVRNNVCSEHTYDEIVSQYYKVAKNCKLTAVGIRKGNLTFICKQPIDYCATFKGKPIEKVDKKCLDYFKK